MAEQPSYPSSYFQRIDPTDDALFYDLPRKVVHIDDGAIAALGEIYAELLPRSGALLDLMSSWRSHLPPALTESPNIEVVGLGMNAEEMDDNPQLTRFVLHDLNRDPVLPFEDGTFTAVLCAVSVQYLTRPIQVFRDVARVLVPGGLFVVSFSNRCFPTKAVAVWQGTSDEQHVQLVGSYFRMAGGWEEPQGRARLPEGADPLFVVWARRMTAEAEP
jgi:SAM-dependent methyltransferase